MIQREKPSFVRPFLNESAAEISPCGKYRYTLWRQWDADRRYALFICLNPSTADARIDDPTVRRCKRFAADWGYGALCIANLFAYRATDPAEMISAARPIGPHNDKLIADLAECAGIVVCAWGAHGGFMERDAQVKKLLEGTELYCLGKTKLGQPRHPLYIKASTTPSKF